MWVQFISPHSLDEWIHCFSIGPCSLQLMNSLLFNWSHSLLGQKKEGSKDTRQYWCASIHVPPTSCTVRVVVGAFQLWKTLVPVTTPLFWLIFIALFCLCNILLSFLHARTVIYPSSLLHFANAIYDGLSEHACFTKSYWLPSLTTTRSSKEKLWNCVCVCVLLGYFASFTLCDSPSPLLPNWYM